MESGSDLQLLHAFVDEELDLPRRLETQSRLRHDARLRAQVQGLRRLRKVIRAHASRHAMPEESARRIRALTEPVSKAGARRPA
jgi:anti-sigma factor RsiW